MDIVKVPYKKTWTATEDEAIFRLVAQHGASNWSLIAEGVDGRSGKQCRERYHNHLQPNVKKGDWTPEENEKIVQLQKIFGNQWAKIAKELPGRTDNAVKNRWHAAMRSHSKESDATPKSQEPCKGAKKGDSVVPPLNLISVVEEEPTQPSLPPPTASGQHGNGAGNTPPVPPHVVSNPNAGASASASRGRARAKSKATAAAAPSSSSSSSSSATRTIPSTIEEIIRKYSPRFESDMHLAAAVDLNMVSHGHHLHSHAHTHAHGPLLHGSESSPRHSPRTPHFTSPALASGSDGTTRGCVLAALRNSLSASRGGDHSTAASSASPPLLLLPGTGPAEVIAGALTDYEDDYEDAEEDFGHYFTHLEEGVATQGPGAGAGVRGRAQAGGCMSVSASESGTRTGSGGGSGSGSGSGCDSSGSESDDSGFDDADGGVGEYCTASGGEDAAGGEDRSSFATAVTAVSCASASSAATFSRFESNSGGGRVHSNGSGVRDSLLLELLEISPRHDAAGPGQPPRDFSDTRSNRSASKRTDREAAAAGEGGVALGHHKQKKAKRGQSSCPVAHERLFSPTEEEPVEAAGGILGSCSYDVLMCDGDFDFDEDTSTF